MATIKELVEKETESLAKAQKLKASLGKVESNIKARSEIAQAAKTKP